MTDMPTSGDPPGRYATKRQLLPVAATHLRALFAITAVALIARLAVLPFATTDGGDAPDRVWHGWDWLSHPSFLTHGVWGPLHVYLVALSMALVRDPVYPPIIMSMLFSVASTILMYVFVQIEFENQRAALLVALSYALYPMAIRNSVSVRSETPFVFFLLLAMIAIALARCDEGSWRHAVAGGLALTLASMLRYEAWMLLPPLSVILWRKRRLMLIFGAVALIHPLVWMVGNGLYYGDPLYSVTWGSRWELESMGRAHLGRLALATQAAAYPIIAIKGMGQLLGLICTAGVALALLTRHRSAVWLIPLLGLMGLWGLAIVRGSLVPKFNYTEIAGTLLFPFSALAYDRLGVGRWAAPKFALAALALLVATVVSFCRPCLESVGLGKLTGFGPIPRIENQEIALQLPPILVQNLHDGDAALISDHYGWGSTRYVALLTRLPRARIFMAPGAPNQGLDPNELATFLDRHPRGVLVALSGSRFSEALGITAAATSAEVGGTALTLEKVRSFAWPGTPEAELLVFRYAVNDRVPDRF